MSGSSDGTDFGKFTGRHKVILVLFFLAFVVMVYGVIPWEDLGLANLHLVVVVPGDDGVLPVLRHPDRHHRQVAGEDAGRHLRGRARDMLGVALIIGVARGITVIMNNGLITDTVLYWAEQAVSGLGGDWPSSWSCTCSTSRSRS